MCRLTAPAAPNTTLTIGEASASFRWVRTFVGVGNFSSAPEYPNWCARQATGPDGALTVELGNVYWVTMYNTVTGEVVIPIHEECQFPGDPAPEPPPPPPTLAEFVERVAVLLTVSPVINPNPAWGGITGLETWLWCEDPGEITTAVSLRGWTADATIQPVGYRWSISGVDEAEVAAEQCGTEADPGGRWVPETRGDYIIQLTATWAGLWTLEYLGTPAGTFALGPADVDGPVQPYPVGEHVGVLTDGGNG